MTEARKKTDLVLSVGEYAFAQDATTGAVKVLSGPTVVNVTGQEYPVVYDVEAQRYRSVELEDAAQRSPMAPQGYYIVLRNPPASDHGAQPAEGSKENAPALMMGRRVNIPGPQTFALWPGQVAHVIEGHDLRSNQYLLGRVYDEDAAKANWQKAVLKAASGAGAESATDGPQGTINELTEEDLSVGKLFVIKGTEVSFYIPPTGVEVVPDSDGRFVRDALTLERLQYCILVDESGDKDYQRGPKVVFPKPSQRFFVDRDGTSIFRPTELNPIQGIHVKVIAPYVDVAGVAHHEGEELFITGEDTSIYFPRPEHSLIRYDGSAKHFATAVPAGEARYVMDRASGEIRTVAGPTMLLPDPRKEVVVRRALTDDESVHWYPGNEEVRGVNETLRSLQGKAPTTRSAVSEGEVRRRANKDRKRSGHAESSVHSSAGGPLADEFTRSASYTAPRSLTLATKYAGVPSVRVWSGFAVMVVRKDGERRVVVGPSTLLLEYDESLEVLALSTGLPKSLERPLETVYLRLRNHVEDVVAFESRDRVSMTLKYALDIAITSPENAFAIRDYVGRVLHVVRRRVRDAGRTLGARALFDDPSLLLASALEEAGLEMPELGLRVQSAELLSLRVNDPNVAKLFAAASAATIERAVTLRSDEAGIEADRRAEELVRLRERERAQTERFAAELEAERIARELVLVQARHDALALELGKKRDQQSLASELADEIAASQLGRDSRAAEFEQTKAEGLQRVQSAALDAETRATVTRYEAMQGPLTEAIQMLGNQQVLATVAEAVSAQSLFGGKTVSDVVGSLFAGTPLQETFEATARAAAPPIKGRGDKE